MPPDESVSTDLMMQLMSLCRCGIYVEVNPHRDEYETVAAYLEWHRGDQHHEPLAPADRLRKMIETDTIVRVQCYPYTPIGFQEVYHYDSVGALKEILSLVQGESP